MDPVRFTGFFKKGTGDKKQEAISIYRKESEKHIQQKPLRS
jgi:hypothetical protein